ncbi:unnamed protein product [Vitrella brassicaformis CCMP3155]|uniref:Uncharacterized protein n=2 Tax=Vitrella brassicaformis TaxID=1169539 RepID=A0A0G4FDZ6_VITBC|nr:unnamed protein product [Vitrella brassicaformis CCMP3155]|eukprot:CEM11423.1 unnamed protein product [Vitrella brassicaformis CCMP3155]
MDAEGLTDVLAGPPQDDNNGGSVVEYKGFRLRRRAVTVKCGGKLFGLPTLAVMVLNDESMAAQSSSAPAPAPAAAAPQRDGQASGVPSRNEDSAAAAGAQGAAADNAAVDDGASDSSSNDDDDSADVTLCEIDESGNIINAAWTFPADYNDKPGSDETKDAPSNDETLSGTNHDDGQAPVSTNALAPTLPLPSRQGSSVAAAGPPSYEYDPELTVETLQKLYHLGRQRLIGQQKASAATRVSASGSAASKLARSPPTSLSHSLSRSRSGSPHGAQHQHGRRRRAHGWTNDKERAPLARRS